MTFSCKPLEFLWNKDDGSLTTEYFAALSASIHMFSAGITYAWIIPSLPRLLTDEYPFEITRDEASYVAIVSSLGFIAGCVSSSYLIDVIGRKKTILLMTVPQVLSFLMIYLSFYSKVLLYLGRISGGIGEGSAMSVVCLYAAEIASPSHRGVIVNLTTISNVIACLFMNVLGSLVDIYTASLACLVFPILQWLTFTPMPESPYYLLIKGNVEDATRSLRSLRRKLDVDVELETMKADVDRQMSEKGGYKDLFGVPANRRALLLMTCFRFFHLFSGMVAIAAYAQVLFESLRIPPAIGTSLIMFVNMLMFMSANFFIDRYGRKRLLIASSAVIASFLLAIGIFFLVREVTSIDLNNYSWLLFTMVTIYYIFLSVGVSPVVGVFASELFSASVKGQGATLGGLVYAICTMVSIKFYQFTSDHLGRAVPFFTFAIVTIGAVIFYIRTVPETKGKTLESIQEELKCSSGETSAEITKTDYVV
ncbi:unnamed protein product [Phaedon cochleariae]|uniref:Major facilitator superfamily (MFS) profile domain-containing protein n=1 Tax=Phaedon cochleariae TaxID=80249 RepID=A0A9P0DIU5_PHACE|nr:unnamed protein product [Phaedon cochleariae]